MTDVLAIHAKNLSVKKGNQVILDGLDFSVKPGTITGLIGPSGSGKTTLMRSIVGVQQFDGNLTVFGKKAGQGSLRRYIGYVTQSPTVYPDLTVWQNLHYFAVLTRASAKDVDAVIATVKLDEYRDQLVANLSGGQKARVSLAVALLGDPQLLVFDEPTVGLDPLLRNELWDTFKVLAKAGKTLLISSHVMDEAERCKHLLLLRDGQLLWNDTRENLLAHTKKDAVGDAFIAMIKKGGAA